MRIFTDRFGNKYNLDDENTYKKYPNKIKKLDKLIFARIGYAICYMNENYDMFNGSEQERIVSNFSKTYFTKRKKNYGVLWYKEKLFRFEKEIENML